MASFMPKGQREQTLVFIGLLAALAAGAYWYLVYSPRSQQLAQQRERVQALATVNDRAKLELGKGNLKQLRAQLAEYQGNLELVRTLVPAGNEVPALLEQVSTAARRVGLDLASVDPQPVTQGSTYDTYRYNVAVLGSYHDLASFLTNVGSLTRIVLPVNLTLQQPSTTATVPGAAKDEAVIEARFQLQTYVARKAPRNEDDTPGGDAGED